MSEKKSLQEDYFKHVYEANEDPWNFETSAYEAAKYAATLAALPRDRYQNALEIGCSIGVLTEMLGKRCSSLLATDVSEKALQKAIDRCQNNSNITFQKMSFPDEIPSDKYDLIMVSEVAYYLSPEKWKNGMDSLYEIMVDEANLVLVHWLPEVHDYPQTGDEVHDSFANHMKNKMTNVFSSKAENYRIDVWEKDASA